MITPWEIYWVLQLDSIGVAAVLLSMVTLGILMFSVIAYFMASDAGDDDSARILKRAGWISAPMFCVCFAAATLLPSTKTAAAMIVVPQIVNSPTIQHEAGDLYKLAKEALRDAIAPKPSK